MTVCCRTWWLIAVAAGAITLGLSWPVNEGLSTNGGDGGRRPKLAVLLVFDQLRGDYLEKWQYLFGEGGFKRLQQDGAWFTNCHYPYADTLTAAGHASLVTGCAASKHGIIGNEWYERKEAARIESITSDRCRLVPDPNDPKVKGADPNRRRVATVGDALLKATNNRARVVSLSLKDRSAILLAALRAIVYWFSVSFGGFVTSTHYHDTLHPFVAEFNKTKAADRWFDKTWDRFRNDLDYPKHSGRDDGPGEGVGYDQGVTFPHPFRKADAKLDKDYYNAVTNSPQGNELLLELAKRAIDDLQLGRKDVPDLLCLSFSSNDLIGHCWGPDSQEVLDVTLRTDRLVKDLLDHLDAKVGKGNYVVVLSADHGVCPLPEAAKARGEDAGRLPKELIKGKASDFLNDTFAAGKPKVNWIEETVGPWIYLQPGVLKEMGMTSAQAQTALAKWLTQQPGVEAAVTRAQLEGKGKLADPFLEKFRLSFDAERSGDVRIHLKPNYLLSDPLDSPKTKSYRTSHGSPHAYDTHVPLLVMGPGVQAGKRRELSTPLATAAILARVLAVPPPAAAEASVPEKLFVRP